MEVALNLKDYFDDFINALTKCLASKKTQKDLLRAINVIKQTRKNKAKIILIGNGGSAAIAEHMAADLSKNAGLRTITISGTSQFCQ